MALEKWNPLGEELPVLPALCEHTFQGAPGGHKGQPQGRRPERASAEGIGRAAQEDKRGDIIKKQGRPLGAPLKSRRALARLLDINKPRYEPPRSKLPGITFNLPLPLRE